MSSDDPKGPKKPSPRVELGKLVENLDCIETVDTMLLEGTPVADVAQFVQEDQGELTDINTQSLINTLAVRRRQRQETDGWYGATRAGKGEDGQEDRRGGYRRQPQTPGLLAKTIYARTKGGIQQMLELEALILAQRDRIDRIMELEYEAGGFSDHGHNQFLAAGKLLELHFEIAKSLGLVAGTEGFRVSLDVQHYSKTTAEVLSNPESRHRVLSIVDRIARHARRRLPETVE